MLKGATPEFLKELKLDKKFEEFEYLNKAPNPTYNVPKIDDVEGYKEVVEAFKV